MAVHLQREIDKLKKQIVLLSGEVEKCVSQAVQAVETRDAELARRVHDADSLVDRSELDVEEECLKILALYQPVAVDLRFIISVLKINSDLERIGDEAVNISGRARIICAHPRPDFHFDFTPIEAKVQNMLTRSLDALVTMNAIEARRVREADDEVDEMVNAMFLRIKEQIRRTPEMVDVLIEYMRIGRHLERIADHATNIAEDVIYMIEGQIVRHQPEK